MAILPATQVAHCAPQKNSRQSAKRTITFTCNLKPGYKYTEMKTWICTDRGTGNVSKIVISFKHELLKVSKGIFTWKRVEKDISFPADYQSSSGEVTIWTANRFGAAIDLEGVRGKDGEKIKRNSDSMTGGDTPSYPVKVGDMWNKEAQGLIGSGIVYSRCTLQGIERINGKNCAIINERVTGAEVGNDKMWIDYETGSHCSKAGSNLQHYSKRLQSAIPRNTIRDVCGRKADDSIGKPHLPRKRHENHRRQRRDHHHRRRRNRRVHYGPHQPDQTSD